MAAYFAIRDTNFYPILHFFTEKCDLFRKWLYLCHVVMRQAKDYDNEPTSGFVRSDDVLKTDRFTDLSNVSNRGYSQLTRAKRHGRWWMLKGLKEPYRQDAVYQVLIQKEYEITSQLQHPLVVSVISLEEVEGLGLCIVMEWIEGKTLKEWLTENSHSQKQRRHIVDMLLKAVSYVHSRQTEHRDLKPSNIMLTHDGQHLKLIDFGLSDTDSHVVLKEPCGTEGYIAPEGPSDIYSLGRILRELRLGWFSQLVVRKCCAPLEHRYTDIASIQRDLHRCWQWPRRLLLILCLALLMAGFYLLNQSHTQQSLQTINDSLKVLKEKNDAKMSSEQSKVDSLQLQIQQINKQRESEQAAIQHQQDFINEAKRKIDKQMAAYGIQEMMDTVSCQRNITIPFLRITDELIRDTKEPELKEYIQERYRKPWLKRMSELPFD